jgi:hypothetical protein
VSQARTGLSLYLAGTIVVPLFGEFPVPLLGFGPSPVVGAFLGLAALSILARRAHFVSDDRAPIPRKPQGASKVSQRFADAVLAAQGISAKQ